MAVLVLVAVGVPADDDVLVADVVALPTGEEDDVAVVDGDDVAVAELVDVDDAVGVVLGVAAWKSGLRVSPRTRPGTVYVPKYANKPVVSTSAARAFVSPATLSNATAPLRVNVSSAIRTTYAGFVSVIAYRYVDVVSTHMARTFVSPGFKVMAPTRELNSSDTFTIFAGFVPVAANNVVPSVSVAAAVTSASPFSDDSVIVELRVSDAAASLPIVPAGDL